MKIIFLDIDGVLNHHDTPDDQKVHGDNRGFTFWWADKRCVSLLNDLTDKGVKLVISSTWRIGHTLDETKELLSSIGVTGEIIGQTPELDTMFTLRGNEIYAWMTLNSKKLNSNHHDFKDYVILDDDSDMLYWQKDNFILVDRWVGVTPSTIFKIEKILDIKNENCN